MTQRLWIRADGGAAQGVGHLMRDIAVAERARDHGLDVRFVIADDPVARVLPARFGFDAPTLLSRPGDRRWLSEVSVDDVVLFDGYHFTSEDHSAARRRARRVGAVDDLGRGRFDVDVLINPSICSDPHYVISPGARVHLGPAMAMIRSSVLRWRGARRPSSTSRLLVTMGGSDAAGISARIAGLAVESSTFDEVLVLVGPAAASPAEGWPDGVTVTRDPPDVGAVLKDATAVVSAAGTTTWELLCIGMPVALVQVAGNQQGVVRAATQRGAALSGGTRDDLTPLDAALHQLAERGVRGQLRIAAMELVDGEGADRVVRALVLD